MKSTPSRNTDTSKILVTKRNNNGKMIESTTRQVKQPPVPTTVADLEFETRCHNDITSEVSSPMFDTESSNQPTFKLTSTLSSSSNNPSTSSGIRPKITAATKAPRISYNPTNISSKKPVKTVSTGKTPKLTFAAKKPPSDNIINQIRQMNKAAKPKPKAPENKFDGSCKLTQKAPFHRYLIVYM